MTAITIRNVPESVAAGLKVRAAQANKSLQAYLLDLLTRDLDTLTIPEAVARMEEIATADVHVTDVLDALDETRSAR